jgi:hypothetical protein
MKKILFTGFLLVIAVQLMAQRNGYHAISPIKRVLPLTNEVQLLGVYGETVCVTDSSMELSGWETFRVNRYCYKTNRKGKVIEMVESSSYANDTIGYSRYYFEGDRHVKTVSKYENYQLETQWFAYDKHGFLTSEKRELSNGQIAEKSFEYDYSGDTSTLTNVKWFNGAGTGRKLQRDFSLEYLADDTIRSVHNNIGDQTFQYLYSNGQVSEVKILKGKHVKSSVTNYALDGARMIRVRKRLDNTNSADSIVYIKSKNELLKTVESYHFENSYCTF